ncbi:MAG: hypothetical protein JO250_11770 [Armatimonadetes bacterium]|nr:hypothetical protein [Armatimonadota bacterium]
MKLKRCLGSLVLLCLMPLLACDGATTAGGPFQGVPPEVLKSINNGTYMIDFLLKSEDFPRSVPTRTPVIAVTMSDESFQRWRRRPDLYWGYVAWNGVFHFLPRGKSLTGLRLLEAWLRKQGTAYVKTTWRDRCIYYARADVGDPAVTGLRRRPVPTVVITVGPDDEAHPSPSPPQK